MSGFQESINSIYWRIILDKKHLKDTLAFPLMFVGDVKRALKVL